MEQQMDVTDLIPKGLGTYWCVFLGGATVIGLSEFAYQATPLLCEKFDLKSISPLDVASGGSFLGWTVSLLFLLAAGVSLINFRLGKKYGDPRPRVAAWFWMAMALLFLSMDTQVAFRETFRDILVAISGTSVHGDGTVWWLAVYGFALGLIGTRILLDMLTYFPSLGLFLLATGSCIAGLCFGFEPLRQTLEPIQCVMLATGLKSTAVLLYFLAFTLFARRQVFRDPEVALRWFAKVWNQAPILQTVREMQAASGQNVTSMQTIISPPPTQPTPPATVSPSPAPTATTPAAPAKTPPATPAVGTTSGVSRPLVQKAVEDAAAKAGAGAKKNDDFDLSKLV